MIAVLKPSWANLIAQTYPPGPEPITTTSNFLDFIPNKNTNTSLNILFYYR